MKWKVEFRGMDEFTSPGVINPGEETIVTLANGLLNSKHMLEITGIETTPIHAIRVYRPPLLPQ